MSSKKITRRNLMKTSGIIAAAGILSACNNGGTPENPSKSTENSPKTH